MASSRKEPEEWAPARARMNENAQNAGSISNAQVANRALHLRQLCLEHASDLVASAERVLKDNGFPNIAYHLAILALEEIGKAGMIASRAVVGNAHDTEWMDKRLGDHVSKLQWAVWTPNLRGGRIDLKDFEKARYFAVRRRIT